MASTKTRQPFVLFITGVSTSGKTTLYESLRQEAGLSEHDFHDIDEHGVPLVGRSAWRRFRVEELLYEAVLGLQKGKSTIICGIVKPHEVVESRYFKPAFNVHFLLLDVPYALVQKRLEQRLQGQPKVGTFEEDFNPDAVQELFLASKNLLRELRHSTIQQKHGHLLEAADLSPAEMHDRTLKLMRQL